MELKILTYTIVGFTFLVYIGIAIWSKANSTKEFYVANEGVNPIINGMAIGADWMSAASFISMAGLISFMGADGKIYLLGWTGGYVLLCLLVAPYLRKYGKFTLPEFISDRYYSKTARIIAICALIFISFTYIAGQMRGVGIGFSRFLEVDIVTGVFVGMAIVFSYAVLGGMKGITYTQVAQYVVMITAYTIPVIFVGMQVTGHFLPQSALGAAMNDGRTLLETLNATLLDLGFDKYTDGTRATIDVLFITLCLMLGTAAMPHVIVRFFTVPKVKDARSSAFWALIFIAILYTSAASVAAFGRLNLINEVNGQDKNGIAYEQAPSWFKNWENSSLIAWNDINGDGKIQYAAGSAFEGKPKFSGSALDPKARGEYGQRLTTNGISEANFDYSKQPFANEIYIDKDIMVLANPEIANLPNWVIALMAAGGIAAALSTAAGLLLVISTAISRDLLKNTISPHITERGELFVARIAAALAIGISGYFGINPPGYVAAIVALAFGLASSIFFPVIVLGIFSKKMNKQGAIWAMSSGFVLTMGYIVYFKFLGGTKEDWFLGISPEGIGIVNMIIATIVGLVVASMTKPPPKEIQEMIDNIRR